VDLELKVEHVLASLAILVVPHVLVPRLKHDLVERKLLIPDGESMDHGLLAL